MSDTDKLVEAIAQALPRALEVCHQDGRYALWTDLSPRRQEQWRNGARLALAAIETQGHQVVPAEPTERVAELESENTRLRQALGEAAMALTCDAKNYARVVIRDALATGIAHHQAPFAHDLSDDERGERFDKFMKEINQ